MNYIGSKQRLSSFIEQTILLNEEGDISKKTFCDLFAGTGAVARIFKPLVQTVIANDIEYFSFVLNKNYIENSTPIPHYQQLIDELNQTPLIETGFIYQHYCLGSGSNRQYFSDINGQKIDTIRQEIEKWKHNKRINTKEYFFLLASLLESADKVANTASVYGAFLKHLKKSAQQDFILTPAIFEYSTNQHQVYNEDSNRLIHNINGDILYLDPPYNARQYGANYHILNTIATYKVFQPKGKTGLPAYTKSKYCSKRTVQNSFEELISNTNFSSIYLSYNNEGLLPVDCIKKTMQKYGDYSVETTDYKRFKADKSSNRTHKATSTIEYLHILKK